MSGTFVTGNPYWSVNGHTLYPTDPTQWLVLTCAGILFDCPTIQSPGSPTWNTGTGDFVMPGTFYQGAPGASGYATAGSMRVGAAWSLYGSDVGPVDRRLLDWQVGILTVGSLVGYLDLQFADNQGLRIVSGAMSYLEIQSGIATRRGGYKRIGTAIDDTDSPYDIGPADSIIETDSTLGPITANLPAVAGQEGREIEVLDWTDSAGANNVTLAAQLGETVNGLASIAIITAGGGCVLRCHAGVWRTKRSTV